MSLKVRQIIFATDKQYLRYYSDVIPEDIVNKAIAGDSVITLEAHLDSHLQKMPVYISKIRSPDIPDLYETLIWQKTKSDLLSFNLRYLKR